MITKKDKHYAEAERHQQKECGHFEISQKKKKKKRETTAGQKDRETETEIQRQKDRDRETKYRGRDERRRCMWQQLERC
jgi:hypothetical protein